MPVWDRHAGRFVMEEEPDFNEVREVIRVRDRRELLEERLVELFVREFGDGNEGTVDELLYAFVTRVLSDEELERVLSPAVSDDELVPVFEKLVKALSED